MRLFMVVMDFIGFLILALVLVLLASSCDPQTPPPMDPDSVSTVNPGPEEIL